MAKSTIRETGRVECNDGASFTVTCVNENGQTFDYVLWMDATIMTSTIAMHSIMHDVNASNKRRASVNATRKGQSETTKRLSLLKSTDRDAYDRIMAELGV